MLKEFLASIADKLRENLGTTDTINAQNFMSKIDDVYDAGYEQGKSQGGGVQHSDYINPEWTDWRYFSYYDNRNSLVARLKYSDTSKGTNFSYMFSNSSTLTEIPALDTSKGTNFSYIFQLCSTLTEIPALDTSKGTNFLGMFNGCRALVTIPKLNMSSMTNSYFASLTFGSCAALENVTFEGTINITQNTTVFSPCPKLTVESLMSFINALSDNTGVATTYTVTIGSTNLAKLTEEQKAIATNKNISLA